LNAFSRDTSNTGIGDCGPEDKLGYSGMRTGTKFGAQEDFGRK